MKWQQNMLSATSQLSHPAGHPQMPTMVWWWVSAMLCWLSKAGSLSLSCVQSPTNC